MRNKIPDDKKRVDISVTINTDLYKMLDEYLIDNDISNRSKYIENLIMEDFIKKGKKL